MASTDYRKRKVLLQTIQEKQSYIKCPSGHPASRLCTSRQCEGLALACMKDSCSACSQDHIFCQWMTLTSFTKLLVSHRQSYESFVKELSQRLIQKMLDLKRTFQMSNENGLIYMNSADVDFILQVYSKKKKKEKEEKEEGLKGRSVKEILNKLKHVGSAMQKVQQGLLDQFESDTMILLKQKEEEVLKSYSAVLKEKLSEKWPRLDPKLVDENAELSKKCQDLQIENEEFRNRMSSILDENQALEREKSCVTSIFNEYKVNAERMMAVMRVELEKQKKSIDLRVNINTKYKDQGDVLIISQENEDKWGDFGGYGVYADGRENSEYGGEEQEKKFQEEEEEEFQEEESEEEEQKEKQWKEKGKRKLALFNDEHILERRDQVPYDRCVEESQEFFDFWRKDQILVEQSRKATAQNWKEERRRKYQFRQ